MSDHWNSLANQLGTPSLAPQTRKSDGGSHSKPLPSAEPAPTSESHNPPAETSPVDELVPSAVGNVKAKPERSRLKSSWDAVASFFGVASSDPEETSDSAPSSTGNLDAEAPAQSPSTAHAPQHSTPPTSDRKKSKPSMWGSSSPEADGSEEPRQSPREPENTQKAPRSQRGPESKHSGRPSNTPQVADTSRPSEDRPSETEGNLERRSYRRPPRRGRDSAVADDNAITEEVPKVREPDRGSDRHAPRNSDRTSDRTSDRNSDRGSDRKSDRNEGRSSERSPERTSDRGSDRGSDRKSDRNEGRSSERSLERSSERDSDRNSSRSRPAREERTEPRRGRSDRSSDAPREQGDRASTRDRATANDRANERTNERSRPEARHRDADRKRPSGFGDGIHETLDDPFEEVPFDDASTPFVDDVDSDDDLAAIDAPSDDADEAPRSRRPRRRRRGGRDRASDDSDSVARSNRDSEERGPSDVEDDEESESNIRHSKIPTWTDTIGVLVEANMINHQRSPSSGRGNSRGRGRR